MTGDARTPPIEDILQGCLDRMDAGASAEDALAAAGIVDPATEKVVADLLGITGGLRDVPGMPAGRHADLHAALDDLHETSYPPPPASGSVFPLPAMVVAAIALVGMLLAGIAYVSRADSPTPPPFPNTAPTPLPQPFWGRGRGWGQTPEPTTAPERASLARSSPSAPAPVVATSAPAARESTPPIALDRSATPGATSPANGEAWQDATGRVTDAASGDPIADAEVIATRADGAGLYVQRSEADGTYRLRLRPGTYRFRVVAAGFRVQWYDRSDRLAGAAPITVSQDVTPRGIDFALKQADAAPRADEDEATPDEGASMSGGLP